MLGTVGGGVGAAPLGFPEDRRDRTEPAAGRGVARGSRAVFFFRDSRGSERGDTDVSENIEQLTGSRARAGSRWSGEEDCPGRDRGPR